ncbi:MAG TPA: hypothetical protein VIV11_39055 [Kofleriaceae bacterium]
MLLLSVIACGPSDRERDCAEVRKILAGPAPGEMPRRYWKYDPDKRDAAALLDMAPLDRLRKLDYRDAEVRDAVNAYVSDTGWTFYTPYSTEAETTSSRATLAKLCNLPQITVETN